MIDRQRLRAEPDVIKKGAARKGVDAPIDELLRVDEEWREALTGLESRRAEMNQVSKSVGALFGQGKKDEAEAAREKARELKDEIAADEERVRNLEARLETLELQIPNVPHVSTPEGKSSEDNVEVRKWGEEPKFDFEPKPHWEIAEALDIIDFERGAKIAGSGFIVYKGWGARLQRALFNFMIDFQTRRNGYHEIYPPLLVNRASLIGTGQLPKFELDQYHTERDDLFLVPTAEVPVTNLHRDEILEAEDLPVRYAAFSSCFRREAGAAGRDTRGLLRVHQFDKVELVKFCTPETSYDELETLTKDAEGVLQELGLHYRVVSICAGDLGFSNSKQYDLELWAPGVGQWLEISSASNFEDFQARRANIRYRPEQGAKPRYAHTLNASGVACPRLMATILESGQQQDGSVFVPEVLRPYVGSDRISK